MSEDSAVWRVWSVFFSPRKAMAQVRERPRWGIPALLILVVMGLFMAMTLPIIMPERLGARMAEGGLGGSQATELEAALAMFADPPLWLRILVGTSSGAVTCVMLFLWSLVFVLFGRLSGGLATLKQVAGVVFWAGLVQYGLGVLVKWPLVVAKGSALEVNTGLALLAPAARLDSFLYRFLTTFGDVFQWWFLVLTIIGIAVVNDFRLSKATPIVLLPWFVITFFFFGLGLLFG
jgi:hypothetical protein